MRRLHQNWALHCQRNDLCTGTQNLQIQQTDKLEGDKMAEHKTFGDYLDILITQKLRARVESPDALAIAAAIEDAERRQEERRQEVNPAEADKLEGDKMTEHDSTVEEFDDYLNKLTAQTLKARQDQQAQAEARAHRYPTIGDALAIAATIEEAERRQEEAAAAAAERAKAPTPAEQTRLVDGSNYYRIGLLHCLETMSRLRPPSETLSVLNHCGNCACHRISWQTADMHCTKNVNGKGCWCLGYQFEKRTIWAETVDR